MSRLQTRRGSMLVIALWLIVILSVAAVALGGYLATETRLMRYHMAQGQARAWAKAGVYLAMQKLALDAATAGEGDWLGDDWAIAPQGTPTVDPSIWVVTMPPRAFTAPAVGATGEVQIHMTDEERRLDLNTVDLPVLERFLNNLEAAKALFDYRSPDDEGPDTSVQPPFVPKNSPIVTIEELKDVPRLGTELQAMAMVQQHGTLVTTGKININTATAPVMKALVSDPALQPTLYPIIDQIVASRPGVDGQLGTVDDCYAKNATSIADDLQGCSGADQILLNTLVTTLAPEIVSTVFRIRATGVVTKPAIRYTIEAIVSRAGGGGSGGGAGGPAVSAPGSELPFHEQAFRVLSWKEG